VSLTQGENIICLPNTEEYTIIATGCHGLEKDEIKVVAGRDEAVAVTAVSHDLTVHIVTTHQVPVYVDVKSQGKIVKR